MTNPHEVIRKILDAATSDNGRLEDAIEVLNGYVRERVIAFMEYERRFRKEENIAFKRECDRLGGMFTMADYGVKNIYKDFLQRKPIKCAWTEEETYFVLNDKDELVHDFKNKTNL